MVMLIASIGLIWVALLALVLLKSYFYLPYRELKRQAAHGDQLARVLFRAAAYGAELKLVLWAVAGISAAAGFVLLAQATTAVAFVVVAATLWLAFVWLPHTRLSTLGARVSAWCTPVVALILRTVYPVAHQATRVVSRYAIGSHTGLYQREDFHHLLEQQKHQGDNRMSQYELELVQRALQFTDCKVRNVLTPAKQVRMLDVRETLGPVLLDELHATGFTHFPVYDGKKTNIVGILTLRGGAASHQAGRVSDVCDKHVAFVHEEDTLAEALQAYHATKHHLFVVIDRFSGYVGIMTVGDIVHQLVGAMEAAPFSQHEDREAVAGKHEAPEPTPPEVTDDSQTSEKVFENTPEVVE